MLQDKIFYDLITLLVIIGVAIWPTIGKVSLIEVTLLTTSTQDIFGTGVVRFNPPDTPVLPVAVEIVASGVELSQIVRDKLYQQLIFGFGFWH